MAKLPKLTRPVAPVPSADVPMKTVTISESEYLRLTALANGLPPPPVDVSGKCLDCDQPSSACGNEHETVELKKPIIVNGVHYNPGPSVIVPAGSYHEFKNAQ